MRKYHDRLDYSLNDRQAIEALLNGAVIRKERWRWWTKKKPPVCDRLCEYSGQLIGCFTQEGCSSTFWGGAEEKYAVLYYRSKFKKVYKINRKEEGTMRTNDALRALLDGKAISHENWKDGEYLFLDNGILTKRTADSRYYPSEFVEAGPDKWRIVKKVIKFNSEFLFEFIDKNEEQILEKYSSKASTTNSTVNGKDHFIFFKAVLHQINEEYIIE